MKKFRTLRPITNKPKYWEAIEAEIQRALTATLYAPIRKILRLRPVKNSKQDLIDAIKAGDIRYQDGVFVGVFSSEVSKELKSLGAVWHRHVLGWAIRDSLLPPYVTLAIEQTNATDERLRDKIASSIRSLDPSNIVANLASDRIMKQIVRNFDKEFKHSMRGLSVKFLPNPAQQKIISRDYSNNLKLYVRKFAKHQVKQMRKQVEEHVFKGNRYEDLAKIIQASNNVSDRKAKFLARQETNLLTSKLREVRYGDVGVDEYLWVSVTGTAEHPVRPLHQELNARSAKGETFKFSDPPKSGTKGEHQNPGEPYGCRCVARPVLRR